MNRYQFHIGILVVALSSLMTIPFDSSMEKAVFTCITFLLVSLLLLSVELIYKKIDGEKEKKAFEIVEHESTPYLSSVAVINKTFPIIRNCSAELVRVNVINNNACKSFFDNKKDLQKVPKKFLWDTDSPTKDLSNNISGKIKIALVTKDEKIVLCTEKPMDYLYIFPERKLRNEVTKKAMYEIEIRITGHITSKADGSEKIIENISFWKIGYISKGHFNSQNIWIKRINEMTKLNSFGLGKPLSQKYSMDIVIEK